MGAEALSLIFCILQTAKNLDETHRGLDADRALPVHLLDILDTLYTKVNFYRDYSIF